MFVIVINGTPRNPGGGGGGGGGAQVQEAPPLNCTYYNSLHYGMFYTE